MKQETVTSGSSHIPWSVDQVEILTLASHRTLLLTTVGTEQVPEPLYTLVSSSVKQIKWCTSDDVVAIK